MYKKRILLASILGFIGGVIPNDKSNIHPVLMGAIFALLFTKKVDCLILDEQQLMSEAKWV